MDRTDYAFKGLFMRIELGVMLTALLGIGFLCQWLAWRIRLLAILFLLSTGIVLGPVTGVLQPDKVLGDLLFPVVSLADGQQR